MPDDAIERRIAEVLTRDRSSGLCPLDGPCTSCDCFDPLHAYDRANAKAVMAEVVTAELGRLRNRITALEANGSELLAKGEHLAAENERLEKHVIAELERLHSWAGLLSLLDEHWPEDIFPTEPDSEGRDSGPRIVSLLRWVERLRAEVTAAQAYSRGVAEDYNTACDERDALRHELALHVGCRVDISIGDTLRLIRGEESNADAPSPVSAATEAHGETTEAQEG